MYNQNTIAEKISLLMKENNITHQLLADAIGVSRPSVTQFTTGANLPSIKTLVIIADYFEVSLDYLCGRTDNPKVNT